MCSSRSKSSSRGQEVSTKTFLFLFLPLLLGSLSVVIFWFSLELALPIPVTLLTNLSISFYLYLQAILENFALADQRNCMDWSFALHVASQCPFINFRIILVNVVIILSITSSCNDNDQLLFCWDRADLSYRQHCWLLHLLVHIQREDKIEFSSMLRICRLGSL